MDWLRDQRTKINRGEKIELYEENSDCFAVEYRDDAFFAHDGEQEFTLTLGEMLTDASWGINYDLDTDSVPIDIAKEYILSRARKTLRELLNKQLVLIELDVNKDEGQQKSFQSVHKRQTEGKELIARDKGFVAEEMTLNLMKKLIIDHGLPIDIEEADVYDDVVNKIDYVITRKGYDRGIEVDANDDSSVDQVGIQFTLMFRKASMLGKRDVVSKALKKGITGELRDVKDLALVNVHPAYIKRAVNKWKKSRGPGGPDSHLEKAAKVDLVQKMLQGLFSEKEIDEIVSNIFDVDRRSIKIRKTYLSGRVS